MTAMCLALYSVFLSYHLIYSSQQHWGGCYDCSGYVGEVAKAHSYAAN